MGPKLDVLKAEQEKELQKELEAIRYDNSIRISEIQNEFQTKYQQLEHEFSVKFETMKKNMMFFLYYMKRLLPLLNTIDLIIKVAV